MEYLADLPSPQITYRTGEGSLKAIIARTNLSVQTFVVAINTWGMTPAKAAEDYGLPLEYVMAALAFYAEHQAEIDEQIAAEVALEVAAIRPRSEDERDRAG